MKPFEGIGYTVLLGHRVMRTQLLIDVILEHQETAN